MPVVPTDRLGKIEFYESHTAPWTTNAAAIGLTPASITALGGLVTKARTAYNNHLAAQAAAKSATKAFYDTVAAMHGAPGAGSDMIETIKVFAATTNNPNVYVLAQIPPPAQGGTSLPPGTPFDFGVELLQDGSLKLRWKCNNPSGTNGTLYEVRRQLGGAGEFGFIGASGVKTFTDETVPGGGGSTPVNYQITAIRSTARGNPAQFIVNFGTGGGGMGGAGLTVASVTAVDGPQVKMAA